MLMVSKICLSIKYGLASHYLLSITIFYKYYLTKVCVSIEIHEKLFKCLEAKFQRGPAKGNIYVRPAQACSRMQVKLPTGNLFLFPMY